jgi:hypothetical protein
MHKLCCSTGQTSLPRPSSVPPRGSPMAAVEVRPQLLGHPTPPLPQAPRGRRELIMPAASHRPCPGHRSRLGVTPSGGKLAVLGRIAPPLPRPPRGRRELAVPGRAAAPLSSSRPAAPGAPSPKLAAL